jgi:hypothetical protein
MNWEQRHLGREVVMTTLSGWHLRTLEVRGLFQDASSNRRLPENDGVEAGAARI